MKEQDFVAGQDFLLAVKKHWTTQMYPAVKQLHADIADDADETADVAKRLETETDYRLFAWFERHLQKMKYSGGFGLAPYHRERADTLLASLSDPLEAETLQLDDRFKQPGYYTSVDIHQHPGGVWSEPISGLIYERGARSTTTSAPSRAAARHLCSPSSFVRPYLLRGASSTGSYTSAVVKSVRCAYSSSQTSSPAFSRALTRAVMVRLVVEV